MKTFYAFPGGHPLHTDDLLAIQDGLKLAIADLAKAFSATAAFRIWGGNAVPILTTVTNFPGAIYYAGEIYTVIPGVFIQNPVVSATWYWGIKETNTTTVTYQDTTSQVIVKNRFMKLYATQALATADGAVGGILYSSVTYFTDVITALGTLTTTTGTHTTNIATINGTLTSLQTQIDAIDNAFVDVAYNASNFDGTVGAWTTDSGALLSYAQYDKKMTVMFHIYGSTPDSLENVITIKVPNGKVVAKTFWGSGAYNHDGVIPLNSGAMRIFASATNTLIYLSKASGAKWYDVTNPNFTVYGQFTFEIQ